MSIILGAAAGACILMMRPGFYSGLIFFSIAYLMESAVRILVGGTSYELWEEAILFHIWVGLPIAAAFGVTIGKIAGHVVSLHGGRS
jgi:hypothetical protein